MDERDLLFSNFMESMYNATRLIGQHNHPRHYGANYTLYLAEAHTLKYIGDHPGISLGELGLSTHRSKAATSMMINKLVEKGFVEKRCASGDVRRCALQLTEKGLEVDALHRASDQRFYEEILALLPDFQPQDFHRASVAVEALIQFYLTTYQN